MKNFSLFTLIFILFSCEDNTSDIDDCTTKIVQGIEKNKRKIYIPSFLRFIPIAKLFFRKWLFRKITKVTSQEES